MSKPQATSANLAKDASAFPADASFAEIAARRRGRIRRFFYDRPLAMDVVVVLIYLVLAAPTLIGSVVEGKWLAAVVLSAIAAVLMARRRYAVTVAAVVAVLEVLATLLNPWGSNVSAGLWFALYAVGVSRPRGRALVIFALASLPLSLLYLFMSPDTLRPNAEGMPENFHLVSNIAASVSIVLSNLIALGIGISVRQRREHEQEVAAWAARTAQLGSVNERTRIAREMHDVVAHSLTVMISLSDGAAVVVRKDPERAGEVLGELSRTGRTALADMRRVLGVLRDESREYPPLQPVAAGNDLSALLDGFRTAGLPLHVQYSGPALPDDPAFGLTVYRILQESLTNVLRYARGLSRVDVEIARDGDAVTIDVSDDGRAAFDDRVPAGTTASGARAAVETLGVGQLAASGSGGPHSGGSPSGLGAGHAGPGPLPSGLGTGQGINGMRERARIFSGSVDAGHGPRGGWRVHTELYWNSDRGKS
ncbi:sensor histidine kinase [Arthrobacter sp. M4]|uniref:sensor histidine kinase n=1 Tax=Arthrobacter sp. M4 TaxID=218160 RepID=UPI001CDC410B|nr:histidine kinase [Arthrobacter sp. M4]MCA4133261.1 histidine kinase [Arthrobacter sp. M4]